jgi:CRP-like cAMP-binding protein
MTPQGGLGDALAGHKWFAGGGDAVRAALAATARALEIPRGTQIFARGEPGERLLLLRDGVVKISTVSLEGREMVLSFVQGGELLGEIAALDGGPRTADATAMTRVSALAWPRAAFTEVMRTHPDFALRVVGLLCERLRQTNEMVEAAVQLPMAARLARALASLLKNGGRRTAEGWRLDFKLSQRDLAAYVGLARENVNRQLKQWEHAGLIALDKGEIVVRDRAAVERLGEIDSF